MNAGLISVGSVVQLSKEILTHPHHLQVRVMQASRATRWIVPAELKAGELIAWIVDQLKLPIIRYRGQVTRYQLNLEQTDGLLKSLDPDESLFENGVQSNNNLRLVRSTKSQLRIFLCHSSRDKQQVRTLYQRLKTEGFKPWLDEENLLPGQDWEREIRKEVSACHVVVVCLSKMSVDKQGYVHREIRLALDEADEKPDGTIFVIPVRLEEVEVPDRLKQWHWADLFKEDGYSRLMSALRERAVRLQDNSER
jgi:hypothetical protein